MGMVVVVGGVGGRGLREEGHRAGATPPTFWRMVQMGTSYPHPPVRARRESTWSLSPIHHALAPAPGVP